MEEVGVFVRVYNVKPYLDQCISSVLSQTYSDFVFYVVDNGCTDGSSEILDRYAAEDSRIRLTRYEKNDPNTALFYSFIQTFDHPYIAILDSDDWWEPNYLERLLDFMQENNLDIAMTGTVNYLEESCDSVVSRKLDRPALMNQKQYAEEYPTYWGFSSTYWGNVIKSSLYKKVNVASACREVDGYGQDTGIMLYYLEQCNRIGIDNSVLYHYRVRAGSISYRYVPSRLEANVGYATVIRRFLENNHVLSASKQAWLRRVHLASLFNTAKTLQYAAVPAPKKLQECSRIMCHPLTVDALTAPAQENTDLRRLMGDILHRVLEDSPDVPFGDIKRFVTALAPSCGPAVTEDSFPLFLRENALMDILLRNGRDELAKILLDFIEENRYIKQYELGVVLQAIAGETSVLGKISDVGFIRKYRDIYWKIWIGQLDNALDMMTGFLLDNKVKGAKEVFLYLYLSVAAIQNETQAFLFGNIRLAEYYLQQKRYEECRTVLSDLEDMGLTNHEEVSAIRDKLKQEEFP